MELSGCAAVPLGFDMKPGIGASVGFEEGTDPGRIVDDDATIIVCGSHVEAESVPVGRMVWGA